MKKLFHYALSITICALLFAGCGQQNAYKHLTHDEAKALMASNPDVIIADVRTPQEFEKKHVLDALNIPLEDLREGNFSQLPDKNATIIIYCWTGRRAQDAAELLIENDYRNVYEMGGIVDWTGSVAGNDIK